MQKVQNSKKKHCQDEELQKEVEKASNCNNYNGLMGAESTGSVVDNVHSSTANCVVPVKTI